MESMTANAPLVSIGLPTYNGERYIREALDSLVAQDYPNLEILVLDNASTDGTLAIVEEYARRDGRIRLIRNPINIGAPANFNLAFRESTGPFFMWAADDDRWEPSYVSACLSVLRAAPSAVLACSRVRFVDEAGDLVELDPLLYDNPDLSSPKIGRRIRILLSRGAWYQVYGLMRRDSLARTRLHTNAYGADVVLLVELALLGPFVLVPETLFQYRVFPSRTEPDRGALHNALDDRTRVLSAPNTHLQEACAEAVMTSGLRPTEKLQAWLALSAAAYLQPTPLRGRIADEATIRLSAALRERNLRHFLKYGALSAAIAIRRFARRSVRAVS